MTKKNWKKKEETTPESFFSIEKFKNFTKLDGFFQPLKMSVVLFSAQKIKPPCFLPWNSNLLVFWNISWAVETTKNLSYIPSNPGSLIEILSIAHMYPHTNTYAYNIHVGSITLLDNPNNQKVFWNRFTLKVSSWKSPACSGCDSHCNSKHSRQIKRTLPRQAQQSRSSRCSPATATAENPTEKMV